jgi:hypothetical protein
MSLLSVSLLFFAATRAQALDTGKYFMIKVVDEQTGRDVPHVELQTVNNIRLYTDSSGVVGRPAEPETDFAQKCEREVLAD